MDEDYYEVSNRDNKKDLSNHVAPEIPDWVEIYNTIDIQSFENKSGNALVIKSITPFQIFMKFIDYRLLEMFTQFTRAHVEFDLIKKGKYQGSQQPEIRTINQTYIRCYISVLILMGLQNQGNRKSS